MTADELATARHSEITGLLETTNTGLEGVKTEVAALSTAFQLHEQADEHVHEGTDKRLEDLEDKADATGQHEIVHVGEQRDAALKTIDVWKGRVWGLVGAGMLALVSALVTFYLTNR